MSLLALTNQPNANGYYFALDTTPVDPTVTAPAFTATGTATENGTFTAKGDAVPAGIGMFNMVRPNNALQWSMGMVGAPAGANSGNNFALFSYDDNGAFLSAPISVARASGNVLMPNSLGVTGLVSAGNLDVDGTITAGEATTVGGGDIQVNGTLGVAQVYDSIYNRPNAGTEVINNTYTPTGTLIGSVLYTPSTSGLYSVTMEVSVDTAGLSWTNGTSLIVGYMGSPFPPFPINTDSYLACDSVANPAGFPFPTTGGGVTTGVYKKDVVALVNLTAGVEYAAQAIFSAGINLGTTGGVRFFIQPLLA
jgi:hypothetical protein